MKVQGVLMQCHNLIYVFSYPFCSSYTDDCDSGIAEIKLSFRSNNYINSFLLQKQELNLLLISQLFDPAI